MCMFNGGYSSAVLCPHVVHALFHNHAVTAVRDVDGSVSTDQEIIHSSAALFSTSYSTTSSHALPSSAALFHAFPTSLGAVAAGCTYVHVPDLRRRLERAPHSCPGGACALA